MPSTGQKQAAQNRVTYAITRGQMPKASTLACVDCHKQAHDYDHYIDYEEEHVYDVEPVCISCHRKREWKRGTLKGIHRRTVLGPLPKDGHFYTRWHYKLKTYKRKRSEGL